MKKKKRPDIRVNFVFNAIKSVMVIVFPLISFPYISRVLGVEGLGKFQYCYSVISYFILFASLGISTYAVREAAKCRKDKNKFSQLVKEIFTINLITTAIVYLVLLIFFVLGAFTGREKIMLVCSLCIIGSTLCVDWLYQALEQYVYISIRTIILQILSLVLTFLLIKSEKDVLTYTALYVFSTYGYCFLNLFQMRKYVNFRVTGKLQLKKHLRPIIVIFGATLSVSIYMSMDTVMLGAICGDYQVGLYSAAVKINNVVKIIINSISVVLLPRLVEYIAKGQKEEYEKLFTRGAELNLFLSTASTAGLFVLIRPIILLFSGKDYLPAMWTGRVLALRLVFSALDNIFYNQVLIPTENENKALIGTAAGAVSNLILNAILIPQYQEMGAAIATVISETVVFVYFICATRKIIRLRIILGGAPKFLVASGIMGFVINYLMKYINGAFLQLLVLVPVGALIYIAILGVIYFWEKGNIDNLRCGK